MSRLAAAFTEQAAHCAALGSPFMARLCRLLAARLSPGLAVTDRLFDWPGEIGPKDQSLPLRLCGAFHALRLSDRAGLAEVYPPFEASDDALWARLEAALSAEAAFIQDWLNSPPQTNEVRRSAALIPLGHMLAARFGLPFVTSEIGASGGLNLRWDAYGLDVAGGQLGAAEPALVLRPEWQGPLPAAEAVRVASRRGVDLNPLDPAHPADALRLRAYLWPDQPERMALTEAALAAKCDPVDRADAVDWLSQRQMLWPGHVHLIFSTVAWQYLPAEAQARGRALIEAAGQMAREDAPLAWFTMENDGGTDGAALTLRLWPENLTIDLGRASFHGQWVRWTRSTL